MIWVCVVKNVRRTQSSWDRNLQGNSKINHVHIVYEPCIMLCICVLKWMTLMNLIGRSWMSWCVTLTLGVQRFGISFKLMLITCVGVSLQGQNTLTRHQWCHIDESDNVELPIVWQFVNYMDSWATFMVFSKMVPNAYESTSLMCIAFRVWLM